jgi:hypothetical protein
MNNTTSKLKLMDMGLKDEFIVHLVMSSSYLRNLRHLRLTTTSNLKAGELRSSSSCAFSEEERIKESRGDSINHMEHNKKKIFSSSPQCKKSYSHDNNASSSRGKAKLP